MGQVTVRDLIDQASLVRDASGLKATRKFFIEGLSDNANRRLFEGIELPDVPLHGTPHEAIPGLNVSSVAITPAPGSASQAFVTIEYSTPSQNNKPPSESAVPVIEVGATLSTIETSFDSIGRQMILNHSVESTDLDTGDQIFTKLEPQPAKAQMQVPCPYVTLQRREPSPFNIAKTFVAVGCMNSVTWFDQPAHTWMCAAIRAKLSGNAFDVSYEFQHRARTWDVELVYTDKNTGLPVADPVQDVGRKTFQIYPEFDYGVLSLGVG